MVGLRACVQAPFIVRAHSEHQVSDDAGQGAGRPTVERSAFGGVEDLGAFVELFLVVEHPDHGGCRRLTVAGFDRP